MDHPTEADIEAYAFSRFENQSEVALEEHLLVCADCQQRLSTEDAFIAVVRLGLDSEFTTGSTRIRLARFAPCEKISVN